MKIMPIKFIAHRCNIYGPQPDTENTLTRIERLLEVYEFDAEIDVWSVGDRLFLGHDGPKEEISITTLSFYKDRLWVHCKNIDALYRLQTICNCFYHTDEDYALTTKGYVWKYPDVYYRGNLVAICTDNPYDFSREYLNGNV